jgi:septum formation protein
MRSATLPAAEIALENALRKARVIANNFPHDLVLGADTVVTSGGRFFGKPRDLNEAFQMLQSLAGRTHEVVTGVVILRPDKPPREFFESSRVTFHPLDAAAIRAYLATIDPLDKAAGYAAQDDNGRIIEKITGSVTNVIGLPMERLGEMLAV